MQPALAVPAVVMTLSDIRRDVATAKVVDDMLPLDLSANRPAMIVSDCCSSNNYPDSASESEY